MIIEYTASIPTQRKKPIQYTIPDYDAILIGSTFTSNNIIKYDTSSKLGCPILNEFLDSDSKEKAMAFYGKYGNIFDFHKYLKFYPQMKDYLSFDGLYEQTCEEFNIPPKAPDSKPDMTYEIFPFQLFEYFRYDLFYISKLISVLGETSGRTSTAPMKSIQENILSLYSSPNIDAFPKYLYNSYSNDELALTPFVSYPFYCYRFIDGGIFPDANLDRFTSLCIPEIKSWIGQLRNLLDKSSSICDYITCKNMIELAQKIINDFLSYYLDQNKSLPLYSLNNNAVNTVNDRYPSLVFALYDVVYYIGKGGLELRYCADPTCKKPFIARATHKKMYCDSDCAHRTANRNSMRRHRSEKKKQATPEAASSN